MLSQKYRSAQSNDVESIVTAAQQKGYNTEPKVGALKRISNVLSAFEPGGELTTLARTGDVNQALGQYGSEVLRGLGSAIPALDPMTKPTDLYEKRQGFADLFKEIGVPEGEIRAGDTRLGSLRGAAGLAGDIVLDPGNLLLAPIFKNIIKGGKALSKPVARIASKTELGKGWVNALDKTVDAVKTAFVPGYKASKVAPAAVQAGQKVAQHQHFVTLETAQEIKELMQKHGAKKYEEGAEMIKKASEELFKASELKGAGKAVPELSPIAQDVLSMIQKHTGFEAETGLRKTTLDYYFPRMLKKDFYGSAGGSMQSPLVKTGLSTGGTNPVKQRVITTAEELAQKQSEGLEFVEPAEALMKRLSKANKVKEAQGFINQLTTGYLKDVNGEPILKTLGKKSPQLPDYVPVLADKKGLLIGDKMLKFYQQELPDTAKTILGTTTKKASYQMHKDVADYLLRSQRVFGNEESIGQIAKTIDAVNDIWKVSVTSVFPAFHVRNYVSNIFNNFVAGLSNPKYYFDSLEFMKGSGELTPKFKKFFSDQNIKTFEEARRFLNYDGVTGAGQFAVDVGPTYLRLLGKEGKNLSNARYLGRKVGTFIEDQGRLAHYFWQMSKGAKHDEALKSVNKFLFDYSNLTPFEAETLKRLMPFYTWSRKNVPLQIEQLLKQPTKYKGVLDTLRAFKGELTDEEKKYLPDYIQSGLGIGLGAGPTGEQQIVTGLDLPLEDLEKAVSPLKTAGDLVNPLAKAVMEFPAEYSLYYGKKFQETPAYATTQKFIAEFPGIGQFLNAKESVSKTGTVTYEVDPKKMYLLKMVAGRLVSSGEKMFDERQGLLARTLNLLTGVKVVSPDLEKEKERKLWKLLEELGLAETFTKQYVPKEVKTELGL